MLNQIEVTTNQLSNTFLKLGIPLPPYSQMHTSKIKQIKYSIHQMHTVLVRYEPNKKLFPMARDLIFETTGQYFMIANITDLAKALTFACKYIKAY